MGIYLTLLHLLFFSGVAEKAPLVRLSPAPKVAVRFSLSRDSFKLNEDIWVTITLTNNTKEIQKVWFDRPRSSTGGPALTTVYISKFNSTEKILEYNNKAILSSQAYTSEILEKYLYNLRPGQQVSGTFSLYDLVVVNNDSERLRKGVYQMSIAYSSNFSGSKSFTVY